MMTTGVPPVRSASIEVAASDQRDPECEEVPRRHDVLVHETRGGPRGLRAGTPLSPFRSRDLRQRERNDVDNVRGGNPGVSVGGDRADARRMRRHARTYSRPTRDQRLPPGLRRVTNPRSTVHTHQGTNEQARDNEQQGRHRDLGRHEDGAKFRSFRSRSGRTFLQRRQNIGFGRLHCRTSPKTNVVATARPIAAATRRQSTMNSEPRGTGVGSDATAAAIGRAASSVRTAAAAPPIKESSRLSVSSCHDEAAPTRSDRHPQADFARERSADRASSRFAMLTHASSRTTPTTARSAPMKMAAGCASSGVRARAA